MSQTRLEHNGFVNEVNIFSGPKAEASGFGDQAQLNRRLQSCKAGERV